MLRRAPPTSAPPCDTCPSLKFCARSKWTCSAFERYAGGRRWKLAHRVPSAKVTRQALADRQHNTLADKAEERRRRQAQTLREWRARNVEHVRAQRRASMNAWYQRARLDPKKYQAFRARTERWRAKNPDKVREYNRRWREKNRERIREKARVAQAAKRSPAAAGTEQMPAGSARLIGPAALSQ